MKKLKIVLGCMAAALAVTGFAACTDAGDGGNGGGGDIDSSTYTVRFETTVGAIPEQSVSAGGIVARPEDPERVGFTFDGWYLNGVLYEFTATVNSDITLVAKYTSLLGGDGTAANPFTIDNAEELKLLKSYLDADADLYRSAKYVQTADITYDGNTIAAFDGEYDGNGHKLTVSAPLFNKLTGSVKNLAITGSVEATGEFSGVLANTAQNANISRVTVTGNITNAAGAVGGLVGSLENGRMEYCKSDVAVNGKIAGGIIGSSSGTAINSIVCGTVTASETAGGAVGVLSAGGLVQNVGAGSFKITDSVDDSPMFISSDGIAGGIVGTKQAGSTVYRAFVYGDCGVSGKRAGGIVGTLGADAPSYSDVVQCFVLNSVEVDGELGVTPCHGVNIVEDFDELGLPTAVWDTANNIPALRENITLPATVKFTVNGDESSVATGSHNDRAVQLFTTSNEHFSQLIEIDTDVQLKSAPSLYSAYSGSEFLAGNYGLQFAANGARFKSSLNAEYSPLTYVLTYAYTDAFEYMPSGQNTAEYIDYEAPIDVYTDGNDYYAFVVQKQYIGSGMYAGFMQSFKYDDGEWAPDKDWCPKGDFSGGAYKYTFTAQYVYTYSYMIIVDDNYTVNGNDGYYLTRFVMRNLDSDGSYTEGAEVISHGQTVMFLGDSENNDDFITAFAFFTDNEGYSDFIYFDETGKLVNSMGFEVVDASDDFLEGCWFDGYNKYTFDIEAGTVTVTPKTGASSEHAYSVESGKIKFTADKAYEFTFVPNVLGSYMLVSHEGGASLVLVTYLSDALDGAWITEDGDVIVVMSEPTYVTFNGTAVPTEDAAYNGVQAVRFTVQEKEYYLMANVANGVTKLVSGDVSIYAVSSDRCCTDFATSFKTAVGGEKKTLSVDGDLVVTFGGATAKAVPEVVSGTDYVLRVTLDGVKYTLVREHDVVIMTGGDAEYIFATDTMYNRLTVATITNVYTNGKDKLEITEDGKFRIYSGATATGEYTTLTAVYSAERAENGGDGRGFVFSYVDDGTTYFFYADFEAPNIRLYRVFTNTNGDETARLETNFVPESELVSLSGKFIREYNGEPDTLTFGADGSLTRKYTDSFYGETNEEYDWYPIVDYNSVTQSFKTLAYTKNGSFTSLVETTATGLNWGLNSYMREDLYNALTPYTSPLYLNGSTSLTVSANSISLKFLNEKDGVYSNTTAQYGYDTVTVSGGTITITATETGFGIDNPRTATATLTVNGDVRKVTLTIDGGTSTVYTSQELLSYTALVGEYEYDGATYTFTAEESWLGSMTIQLSVKKGTSTQRYTYYQSEGVVIMSNGAQALGVRSTTYKYMYVWKDGDNLMVSESLDASKAIAAVDKAIAGMPSIDELQAMLNGNEYTAADGSTVSFEKGGNAMFGTYFTMYEGDNEIDCDDSGHKTSKGCITLMFGISDPFASDTRVVKVYLNDSNVIVKLVVSETEDGEGKEYAPAFVPPTVDEMKELLLDTGYKAANGKTAMFYEEASWMGTKYYYFAYDGKKYDYGSGAYANGVYTYTFTSYTAADVTVVVTYTKDGIQKITISGTDFLPITLPTPAELNAILDGNRYDNEDDETMYVTFEVTSDWLSGGDQLDVMLYSSANTNGKWYCLDKCTKDGVVYTLKCSGSGSLTITVTLYPDGTVKFVTIDGDDYYPA